MPVTFPDPEVFIDCRDAPLFHYAWDKDIPIINMLNEANRPSNREGLTQMIAAGRQEHRMQATVLTLGLTIGGMVLVLYKLIDKAMNAKIRFAK